MIALIAAAVCAPTVDIPRFEGRALWVDATANLAWTIDPASVRDFVANAKRVGFNEIIVDVKPINGNILFSGTPEERFTTFRETRLPENYDLLDVFSKEARAQGMRICAAINVFSEGHSYFPGVGLAFTKPKWQTQVAVPRYHLLLDDYTQIPLLTDPQAKPKAGYAQVTPDGAEVPGTDLRVQAETDKQIIGLRATTELVSQLEAYPAMVAVFVDPLEEGVHERMLNLIRRTARYDIDGIVFDRLRYSAIDSGMGSAMRAAFEVKHGKVGSWPESVFFASPTPGPLRRGPRFAEWMQFRAEVMQEFLRDARKAIHEVSPKLTVASYVGAGWETYYEVGVDYASDDPIAPYSWAGEEYGLSGYAGYCDYLMTGCFYKVAKEIDPGVGPGRERFTVEGGAKLTAELAGDSTYVLPSLYGLDWEKNEQGLRDAIAACRRYGSGMMFFDAIYIIRNNWWSLFEQEFRGAPKQPPYLMSGITRGRN
ncbi:MAG: hypothetical protein M3R13_04015 [Armatimonadota bacterium]|nr:hypothetical protein [Armatimonadota bacterium]